MHDASGNPRRLLLNLFQQGLTAVDGRGVVAAWLKTHPLPGPFHLAALGKAAGAMAAGVLDAAGTGLVAGLLVSRYGYLDAAAVRDPRIRVLEAGHPLPDEQSLAAGDALLHFLREAPSDARFLFLISGGTSSLLEAPVEGLSLEDLRRLNTWLLASGLPISDINRVRAALSRIKGGRLAEALHGRQATVLLMSDVPGDVPSDIGSGLLLPSVPQPPPELPARFATLPFQEQAVVTVSGVDAHIVASNLLAREAVCAAAAAAGHAAFDHGGFLLRDAAACGEAIAGALSAGPAGVHVWGGETTVKLPEHPGRGGRNQQLALAAARRLATQPAAEVTSGGAGASPIR